MTNVTVVASSRRNRSPDKPYEDAYAVRLHDGGAILVVADGVTRSRNTAGAYPQPSGSAVAAHLVAETLAEALAEPADLPDMAAAFARANRAVEQANQTNGVWERLDYGEHDLWCAVATAVVIHGGQAWWGHIGDSVLLHLPLSGGLRVCTPDQVAAASEHLATLTDAAAIAAGGRERYARQQLRNHPEVPHSYGALTGEQGAERYVVTGQLTLAPGDRLVLCTDGLGSLRYRATGAAGWELLEHWLAGPFDQEQGEQLLDAVEAADEQRQERSDDKTVLVATVGK